MRRSAIGFVGRRRALPIREMSNNEEQVMNKFFLGLALAAALPLLASCTKSVEKASRDVQRAHEQAVKNVEGQQKDVEQAQRNADQQIAKEQRDVDETAARE